MYGKGQANLAIVVYIIDGDHNEAAMEYFQ